MSAQRARERTRVCVAPRPGVRCVCGCVWVYPDHDTVGGVETNARFFAQSEGEESSDEEIENYEEHAAQEDGPDSDGEMQMISPLQPPPQTAANSDLWSSGSGSADPWS